MTSVSLIVLRVDTGKWGHSNCSLLLLLLQEPREAALLLTLHHQGSVSLLPTFRHGVYACFALPTLFAQGCFAVFNQVLELLQVVALISSRQAHIKSCTIREMRPF